MTIATDSLDVLTPFEERTVELLALVQSAAIAWATCDREVRQRARRVELLELAMCELADRKAADGEHSPGAVLLQIQRDEATIALRAAVSVLDGYEETWHKAARDLLDALSPDNGEDAAVPR